MEKKIERKFPQRKRLAPERLLTHLEGGNMLSKPRDPHCTVAANILMTAVYKEIYYRQLE